MAEASRHLTGVAVEITPTDGFNRDNKSKEETERLPLSAFWGQTQGIGHALLQILALSVMLGDLRHRQPRSTCSSRWTRSSLGAMPICSPVLALGFGLLTLIGFATYGAAHRHSPLCAEHAAFPDGRAAVPSSAAPAARPFSKSAISAISCRASAPSSRSATCLSEGLIAALIDGLMAVATLAMIFFYSPPSRPSCCPPCRFTSFCGSPCSAPSGCAARRSSRLCEGELDLHRDRPCRAEPEAFQPGE